MRKRGLKKLMASFTLLVMAVGIMSQSIFAAPVVDPKNDISKPTPISGPKDEKKEKEEKIISDSGWIALGEEGFSKGEAQYTAIALDNNDVPYVAYADAGNGKKVTVKKYTENGWKAVGKEGFSSKAAKNVSIVFDKNNTPYVAYVEEPSSKIVVSKLVKDKWTEVGGFVGFGEDVSLAVDSKGTPYVAYTYNANILCGISFNGITVSKYEKGIWKPEFNEGSFLKSSKYSEPSIALDARDNPYIAFSNNGINVMKASGPRWSDINIASKPKKGDIKYISLAVDNKGQVFVAYQGDKDKAIVSKNSNGEYWEVSEGKAEFISLALDREGTPYVAYVDAKKQGKAIVKKYEDGKWNALGDNGLSKAKAKFASLAVDSNGNLYVAYQDDANKKKATVRTFANKFVVTFDTDGGTQIADQYVPYNGKVQRPADPIKYGYMFENWYTDKSFTKVYDFDTPVKSNLTLYAKYTKMKNCGLTVKVEGNGSVVGWTSGETKKFELGEKVKLVAVPADDSKFVYWKDSVGRVLCTSPEFTFELGCEEVLTVYFFEKSKHLVTFKNGNGEIIKSDYLVEGEEIVFPEPPTLLGHKFIGWDKTAEEIKESKDDIIVTALFEKLAQTITVEVRGGSGSGQYNIKDYVIVEADEPEAGKKFAYWEDALGNIVSFNPTYGFTAARDIVLTAVYVSEADLIEEQAKIAITSITVTDDKITFVAERAVPEGNTIILHGIIATNNPVIGSSEAGFVIGREDVYKAQALTKGLVGIFVLNKAAELNETWYARGYVIYKDSEGNVFTVYSDIAKGTRQ